MGNRDVQGVFRFLWRYTIARPVNDKGSIEDAL